MRATCSAHLVLLDLITLTLRNIMPIEMQVPISRVESKENKLVLLPGVMIGYCRVAFRILNRCCCSETVPVNGE
jgi:hypothetical protein